MRRAVSAGLIAMWCLLLPACALPPLEGRSESHALTPAETAGTALGRALARIFHACSQRRAQRGIAARI
jgi:cardiolipin synthase C